MDVTRGGLGGGQGEGLGGNGGSGRLMVAFLLFFAFSAPFFRVYLRPSLDAAISKSLLLST